MSFETEVSWQCVKTNQVTAPVLDRLSCSRNHVAFCFSFCGWYWHFSCFSAQFFTETFSHVFQLVTDHLICSHFSFAHFFIVQFFRCQKQENNNNRSTFDVSFFFVSSCASCPASTLLPKRNILQQETKTKNMIQILIKRCKNTSCPKPPREYQEQ